MPTQPYVQVQKGIRLRSVLTNNIAPMAGLVYLATTFDQTIISAVTTFPQLLCNVYCMPKCAKVVKGQFQFGNHSLLESLLTNPGVFWQ